MDNNIKDGDEEVIILLDEDGNEIIVDESLMPKAKNSAEEAYNEEFTEVEAEPEYELEGYEEESFVSDEDYEDEEYSDDADSTFGGLTNKLLFVFGGLIAVIAIAIGLFYITRKNPEEAVDFSNVGSNIAAIGIIGEENITAITEAQGVAIDELNEAIKNYDYAEADAETGITTVSVTLTSILKDLKVKIVNSKGKLVANVPFELEVTTSDGTTTIWTDTDKDGIVYQTDLAGGTYTVKLVSLNGYDAYYDFDTTPASLAVKTQLDYQKVDVKNEIKAASEVAESEDAAAKETTVESKLTDTVKYVLSAKTASSNGYTAISKDTITDPLITLTTKNEASIARFFRLSGVVNTVSEDNPEGGSQGVDQGAGTETVSGNSGESSSTETADNHTAAYPDTWTFDGTNTHSKACSFAGCTMSHMQKENCTESETPVSNNDGTHTFKCLVCGGALRANVACTYGSDNKCTACGHERSVAATLSISTPEALYKDKTIELTATPTITPEGSGVTVSSYEWKSSDETVAKVTANNEKVTVTGVKAGTATITCTAALSNGTTATQTASVTVKAIELKFDVTGKKALFIEGDTLTVTCTTTGGATNKVTWTSSNTEVATIEPGSEAATSELGKFPVTIKGVGEGTTTIVATSTDDNKITQTLTVVVTVHPKNDKATKLVDKNNAQVYVYDSSTKKYVEATYADYYSGADLFTAVAVTYTYTGWWTIDAKTYYFDANGKKVTGEQVILGAKYTFGSDGALKSGTGTFGIDVSSWNGTIDWTKVAKSGVNYAIIRCGYRGSTVGGLVQDSKFATNIRNATDAGIKVGVYFFTQAISEAEAVEEASTCLSLIEGYKISYPIFIDVENATNGRANSLSKTERTAIVSAFCKTITNAGYKAGVYANKTWFTNHISTSELTGYTIWLAQYAASPTYTATRYDLWQYSDEGSINGVSGKVDLDLSYLGY